MSAAITPSSRSEPSASLVVRAPTRIDFGGGWTDVPPYSDEIGGYVCNVAITRYSTVELRADADPRAPAAVQVEREADRALVEAALQHTGARGLTISLRNDFPVGAGLGGSSAAGVAVVAALSEWTGRHLDRGALAETSREIEIGKLGIPGGRQDHYAAAYGGALGLRFGRTVEVEPIPLTRAAADELGRRCTVIYTGESRISGETITAVLDSFRRRDTAVLGALERMRSLAEAMPAALRGGDVELLGRLVGEQWRHQRSLHPAIPTPKIDAIIAEAESAGAVGCKALGASGGGCVLVIARAETVAAVREAIAGLGTIIDFGIDLEGVRRCD